MKNARPLATALASAAALLAAATAAAQTPTAELPRMVSVATPRGDARALCPDVDDELEDALAATVRERAEPAVIDVRFQVQNGRVGAVDLGAGPLAYRRLIRRTIHGLSCDSGDTKRYTVSLRVQIQDAPGAPAVALQAGTVVARADLN